MEYNASYLIEKLNLKLHPEGGYYIQMYKDPSAIKKIGLQDNFDDDRSYSTAIYYLLYKDKHSVFHKIKSDEVWHYYSGNTSLKIYEIKNNGKLEIHTLGNNINNNETFVCVIEKNEMVCCRT
jgi:predicted cupin superfamily sugar epimerase